MDPVVYLEQSFYEIVLAHPFMTTAADTRALYLIVLPW